MSTCEGTLVSEEKWDYSIGETAYVAAGEEDMWKGTVVHRFLLPGWMHGHYVIEIETAMDPLLYVRAAHEMSRKGGSIDLYKVQRKDPVIIAAAPAPDVAP